MKIILCNLKEHDEKSGEFFFLNDLYLLCKESGLCPSVLMPLSRKNNFKIDEVDIVNLSYYKNRLIKWLIYFFVVPFKIRRFDIIHFSLDLPIISSYLYRFIFRRK